MYTCKKCHKEFNDEPARKNATGMYCLACHEAITAKIVATNTQRRIDSYDGKCTWCGAQKSELNMSNRVCNSCIEHRAWLLKCIRFSRVANDYVKSVEEREKVARQTRMEEEAKRQAEIQAVQAAIVASVKPSAQVSDTEARMLRMEKMLNKLTTSLGL